MKSRLSIFLFLMLCVGDAARSAAATTAADLDALATAAFASGATPGMAIAVVQGDETRFAKGYGYADVEGKIPMTAETVFYLASTGKAFTALEAQLLASRGLFALDDPLSALLPGVTLDPALDPSGISLRDLLTHTHGISGRGPVTFRCAFTGEGTSDELKNLLRFHPPAKDGRAFSYSNLGYDVAGLIIGTRVKEGWRAAVERDLLGPFGMKRSGTRVSRVASKDLAQPYELGAAGFERVRYGKKDENMNAAGGELSTAADLARFLRVHLNGGKLEGRSVVPEHLILESRRRQVEQSRSFGEMNRYGWGLGWDLATYEGDTLVSRFGDFPGFRSHVSYMPSRGIGVVVLVNGGGVAAPLADAVALSVYDRLLERGDAEARLQNRLGRHDSNMKQAVEGVRQDRERRAARDQRLAHPLRAYEGVYENAQFGRMKWAAKGDRLEVTMGAAGCMAEVFDATANKMRVELTGSGGVVEFVVPPDGARATALRFQDVEFTRSGS